MTSQQSYTVIKQLYILIINYNGLSPSNIYECTLYDNGLSPSNIYEVISLLHALSEKHNNVLFSSKFITYCITVYIL